MYLEEFALGVGVDDDEDDEDDDDNRFGLNVPESEIIVCPLKFGSVGEDDEESGTRRGSSSRTGLLK